MLSDKLAALRAACDFEIVQILTDRLLAVQNRMQRHLSPEQCKEINVRVNNAVAHYYETTFGSLGALEKTFIFTGKPPEEEILRFKLRILVSAVRDRIALDKDSKFAFESEEAPIRTAMFHRSWSRLASKPEFETVQVP